MHPAGYDYRRAAVEALFFPRLFDRWMQNLRRCAGFKVQYFGAIEPQRRLAPHIHVAMRGAIPRQVIRKVTKATYLQLWWPSFEEPKYTAPAAALGPSSRDVPVPLRRLPPADLGGGAGRAGQRRGRGTGGGDAVRVAARHRGDHRAVG